MKFLSPDLLWLLAFIPILWFVSGRSQIFGHTQTAIHKKRSAWSFLSGLTKLSKVAVWTFLCLALAQLQISSYHTVSQPGGTIDFTQDVSGSMSTIETNPEEILLAGPQGQTQQTSTTAAALQNAYGVDQQQAPPGPERIDVSLGAISKFINESQGLRIALTSFDDSVYYLYPPTTNHKLILDLLPSIKQYIVNTGGGGTNFDGPLPGGYEPTDGALQGAINVLSKTPANQTRIFIMVTDGDSSIDPDRAAVLAAQFKALHIHMFVFGIGDEWGQNGSDIQPLVDFVQSVGGEVAPVEDPTRFNLVASHIKELASSTVHTRQVRENSDALIELLKLAAIAGFIYLGLAALSREQL